MTADQIPALAAAIVRQLPWKKVRKMKAQFYIKDEQALREKLEKLLVEETELAWTEFWEAFYSEHFGIKIDAKSISLPEVPADKQDFKRLLLVAKGVTPIKVVKALRKIGVTVWLYTENLDKDVTQNERDSRSGSYAIYVRERVEADEELVNLSAEQIDAMNQKVMTLLEHLLYELAYFLETGKHLDIVNVTLCAGSRGSDGDVPGVNRCGGGVYVLAYNPSYAAPVLRARAVVSGPLSLEA